MHCACLLLLFPAVLPLLGGLAPAQSQRDDLTPLEIAYTTAVAEDLASFEIELEVRNVARPTLRVAMPNWTPGAYGIRRYGERVEDLTAHTGEGGQLPVLRLDHQTWSIDCEGISTVRVSYRVPVARGWRGRQPDPDQKVTGLRLEGPASYLYVVGEKERPVTARYRLPEGWRLANGLLATADPLVRAARDYDTFIDAPGILGRFEERSFSVAGTDFRCVYFENEQNYDFDLDAFAGIVQRIVANQGELYGSFPFADYVFLFSIPGGGGLEHLNSTSIGLDPVRQKEDPEDGASVVSHEFFHAWNVKRIRPAVLGPFEYEHENYTNNLYVSEGWTSYFGDLTLARTGIWSEREYLDHLARVISAEQSKERRREHSVEWASRNVWHRSADEEGPRVDYYGKGEMLGALIDLKMRHDTGGRKNLNDVMRLLNRWFAERGVGFAEDDIERACTAVSNVDFGEFFARHVAGTVDPPLAEILGYAGLDYAEEVIACDFPFALRGRRVGGRPGQAVDGDGPRPGETLVSAAGAEFAGASAFLRDRAAGDKVALILEAQDGARRELEVELVAGRTVTARLSLSPAATTEQLQLRAAWLGSAD